MLKLLSTLPFTLSKNQYKLIRATACLLISLAVIVGLEVGLAPGAKAEPQENQLGGFHTDLEWDKAETADCNWENASWIQCDNFLFVFDPSLTSQKQKLVFTLVRTGPGGQLTGYGQVDIENPIPWYLAIDANGTDACITKNSNLSNCVKTEGLTGTTEGARNILVATGGASTTAEPTVSYSPTSTNTINFGSFETNKAIHRYEGKAVYEVCGIYMKKGQPCYDSSGSHGADASKFSYLASAPDIGSLGQAVSDSITAEDDCDDSGNLSFLFCPLLSYTRDAVSNLIGASSDGTSRGYLLELLTISPMDQSNTSNLFKVWVAFRDISLGLYILVFIAIVFGNGLGMDAYTIKRTVPRLAAGALLTMMSFFIVQTMVDLSNLLGNGVPALIKSISADADIKNFGISLGAGSSALGVVLLILFSLAALVALLVGMAGLLFRQIMVYILVIVSPLAFVAWVLPNTESLFKKWWTNLIKLCFMFPIITGMLALALLFATSLDKNSSPILGLAAAVAPLAAIAYIPKTFKMGGELFAAGAGFIAGRASDGIGKVRGGSRGLGVNGKDAIQKRTTASLLNRAQTKLGDADRLSGDDPAKASRAARRGKAMMGAAMLASGKFPSRRGLTTAAKNAQDFQNEQTTMEAARAEYLSGPQLDGALLKSAQKLVKNPSNPVEIARFRALQKKAIQGKRTDALTGARSAMYDGLGEKQAKTAYATLSGPNLGDIGDAAADAGAGEAKFNINGLSVDKIAGQHTSTLKRWSRDGTLGKLDDARLEQFNQPRVWQRMSQDQLELIGQEMKRRLATGGTTVTAPAFSTSPKQYRQKKASEGFNSALDANHPDNWDSL